MVNNESIDYMDVDVPDMLIPMGQLRPMCRYFKWSYEHTHDIHRMTPQEYTYTLSRLIREGTNLIKQQGITE